MGYHAAPSKQVSGLLDSIRMLASIPYERALPFRSRAAIERRRDRRIRNQVRRAYETVPFYREQMREAGVHPDQIQGAADLHLVPPTDAEALREDPLAFVSSQFDPEQCHKLSTSGRSGRPKYYYYDPRSLLMNVAWSERHEDVFKHFAHRRIGRRLLVMNVDVSVAAHVHKQYRRQLSLLTWLGPCRRQVDLSAPFEEQVDLINRFKPEQIISYGTFIGDFFSIIHNRGVEVHHPELISLGGEGIFPEHRRLIEEEFGIPIVMTYQSGESLKIGFECQHRRHYHLHEDLCHVRLLDDDGRDVPEGEVGRVHITNLVNQATVLINYDQGDLGRMLPVERCACGRNLRRMELVDGRRWPMLRTLDGRCFHCVAVLEPLQHMGLCEKAQIVIERPNRWRILLRDMPAEPANGWRERARAKVEAVIGSDISVTFEPVERFELTENGKWVPVLVRCLDEAPYNDR